MSSGGGAKVDGRSAAIAFRLLEFAREEVVAAPIDGVFDDARNPRLPLEEAVDRMQAYLQTDFAGYLFTSSLHAGDLHHLIEATPGMQPDHARAIYLYTAVEPLYAKLNEALRSSSRMLLQDVFFPYLRLLLEALGCLPRAEKQTLYRGVNRDLVAE